MCWTLSSKIEHQKERKKEKQTGFQLSLHRFTYFGWSGYESDGSYGKLTIRDQLAQLVGDRDDDFSIPLGKNLKKVSAKFLTISQKRNIKRQAYLNEVSQRNDSVFFATIGAFVILPPIVILGIAIITGYVQLFPWNIFLYYFSTLVQKCLKYFIKILYYFSYIGSKLLEILCKNPYEFENL